MAGTGDFRPQSKTCFAFEVFAKFGFAAGWIASVWHVALAGAKARQLVPSGCFPKRRVDLLPIVRRARTRASHNTKGYNSPGKA